MVASKYGFTTVFIKAKDLRRQLRTKKKRIKWVLQIYEVDCNNCKKKYTDGTGWKLKEGMKEHKDDGEKSREDKKITGLS